MARRKRRRTKTSRSQHPATRPRLTLGDVVRVKDGVMEPDYDGYCIGGWSGVIIALDTSEQTPMALIEWDASTQRDRCHSRRMRLAASSLRRMSQRIAPWLRPGRSRAEGYARSVRCQYASANRGQARSHPDERWRLEPLVKRFTRLEIGHPLRRHIDRLSGFGVAPTTRCPKAAAKAAKTTKLHFIARLQRLDDAPQHPRDHRRALPLVQPRFSGDLLH